jgi:acetyl-CoA acetyltransferase
VSAGPGVAVRGVGIHPFGKHADVTFEDLAATAIDEALERSGMRRDEVQEVFVGNSLGPNGVAARVAEGAALFRLPVSRIEQACAAGSTALRLGADQIASGRRDVVLVVGVEKMSAGLLDLGDHVGYDARMGTDVLPLLYGLKASQYMDDYGVDRTEIAEIAARAHRRALAAPHARYGMDCTAQDVLESPAIADPITRLQLAGNADGAAAAVLTSARAAGAGDVTLRGWCGGLEWEDPSAPMTGGWDHRERVTEFLADELYESSGLAPCEIDVVQLNDASSIAEPLYLEALGLAERGGGVAVALGADGPAVNTDGGLVGRGHSLGATGLAMLYELWLQLMGQAGARQTAGHVQTALLHSHGLGGDNLFALTR